MRRFFHLTLLIGALFGLLGQGVAMAMSPECASAMARPAQAAKSMPMAGKMDCCPETQPSKNGSKPAKDSMPNCPMMRGCFVSLAMGHAPAVSVMIPVNGAIANWPLAAQLTSRATAPEPPPPTI